MQAVNQTKVQMPQVLAVNYSLEVIKDTAVDSEMDVFDSRRGVYEFAMNYGFNREKAMYLKTAITELATNIVFHSHGGNLTVYSIVSQCSFEKECNRVSGILVVAVDRGPGISDVNLACKDGYSSKNSLGFGLPSVMRLMDDFEIDSNAYCTKVMATLWKN